MEVIIVALVGVLIIGTVWEWFASQQRTSESVTRHERLMRELHRHD